MFAPAFLYRAIPLPNKGLFAIVDAADYEHLSRFRWEAWFSKHTNSYYARRRPYINGIQKTIYMHREILGLDFGDDRVADHVSQSLTLVNVRANLRIANRSQSQMNRRKPCNGQTIIKGIRIREGIKGPTYQTCVAAGGKEIRRSFKTLSAAIYGLAANRRHLHKQFSCFN